MAALAQELGLTLVPMDDCKLWDRDGRPVAGVMDQRIQALWNIVLDECAEKQQQHQDQSTASREDSRGETSEESNGDCSSSAGSEATEPVTTGKRIHAASVDGKGEAIPAGAEEGAEGADLPIQDSNGSVSKGKAHATAHGGPQHGSKLKRRALRARAKPQTAMSLGKVLEETARKHFASFLEAEHQLWGWHRGNLEISCGAVSDSIVCKSAAAVAAATTTIDRRIGIA